MIDVPLGAQNRGGGGVTGKGAGGQGAGRGGAGEEGDESEVEDYVEAFIEDEVLLLLLYFSRAWS